MRSIVPVIMAGIVLFPLAALAGTVGVTDGAVTSWQPSRCAAPVPAASIIAADPETSGEDMNARITAYNKYVDQAQAYMNCVSEEAQTDANATSETIAHAAEDHIQSFKKSVDDLGAPLRPKKE